MYAARDNDNPEVSRVLIQAGADVNAKGEDISTPIPQNWQNDPAVRNIILQSGGIDLYLAMLKTKEVVTIGETPLTWAVKHNKNPEVVDVLIQAGADLSAKDENGALLLSIVAGRSERREFLNVLIQAGADVNAKGSYGETPLMSAAKGTDHETMRILIQAGADVNAKDDYGSTVLMHAVRRGSYIEEALDILIQAGADVNAKDDKGETALELAKRLHKSQSVVSFLEAAAERQ